MKPLQIFFRHDQRLFGSISSLIFSLLTRFYRLAAGSSALRSAVIVAFQPFGDFLRADAHWHAPVGWKETHEGSQAEPSPHLSSPSVPESSCRSAWAKLIAKVYEVDPMLFPYARSYRHHRCGGGEKDPPPPGEDRASAPRAWILTLCS